MPSLFDSLTIGHVTLKNRIILAPLTRMRANDSGVLPDISITYYSQRASAGLEITEATQISPIAQGYARTPGFYSSEQLAQWHKIADAVHAKGSFICAQLWHTGRISHSCLHPNNEPPVSPTDEYTNTKTTLIAPDGGPKRVQVSPPKALTVEKIQETIKDYAQATLNVKNNNFDFAEVHAAHGYLLHQFQSASVNTRNDQYGGSVENRARLTFEVLDAVISVWDKKRIGIRISPHGTFNNISTSNDNELLFYMINEIAKRDIAYLHISEPDWVVDNQDSFPLETRCSIRDLYNGIIIVAGGYTLEKAQALLDKGLIDAVAFGRKFIANPDLPERLKSGAPLNPPRKELFYGYAAQGYIDYPTLSDQQNN